MADSAIVHWGEIRIEGRQSYIDSVFCSSLYCGLTSVRVFSMRFVPQQRVNFSPGRLTCLVLEIVSHIPNRCRIYGVNCWTIRSMRITFDNTKEFFGVTRENL